MLPPLLWACANCNHGDVRCNAAPVDGSYARRFDVNKARGRIATENCKLPKLYAWRINQVNIVYGMVYFTSFTENNTPQIIKLVPY